MTAASEASSGKTHRDENFPVASWLIHPRHRGAILAFYRFVRAADDVADHGTLTPEAKLALLDRLEATLTGRNDAEPAGVALREALAARDLPPGHAQDLLTAFRMDVTKLSYDDWDDLMGYCRYSAMPVGRFVLAVHGEPRTTWVASDALCAALQVINHLQDCGADYRNLHRVYIPKDAFAAAGSVPEELGLPTAAPGLLSAIRGLALRTDELLSQAAPLPIQVEDGRLALECAVIIRLAHKLNVWLQQRDPLCERVHLRPAGVAGLTLAGLVQGAIGRLGRARS